MAISAAPYTSIEKAKRFRRRMGKPWIAKVTLDREEGYWNWKYPDEDLLESDSLFDWLCEIADRKKKDFDIRPYARKEVRSYLDYDFSGTGYPLEAIAICRETVGLVPLKSKSLPKKSEPITFLKRVMYRISSYEISAVKDVPAKERRKLRIDTFVQRKDAQMFIVRFASSRGIDDLKDYLKVRYTVLSITKPYPAEKNTRLIVLQIITPKTKASKGKRKKTAY